MAACAEHVAASADLFYSALVSQGQGVDVQQVRGEIGYYLETNWDRLIKEEIDGISADTGIPRGTHIVGVRAVDEITDEDMDEARNKNKIKPSQKISTSKDESHETNTHH